MGGANRHLFAVFFPPVKRIGIAIAGGSCSGKTTLALALAQRHAATLVRIDDYYRPFDHLTFEQRCEINFDHPESINHELLVEHVRSLIDGKEIEAPRYDFTRHAPFARTERVEPTDVIVVEGLFALAWPELAELCEVRVFVEAPEEVCLDRRVERDVAERDRTPGEVVARFHSQVAPMFRRFVAPSAERATIRVDGTGDLTQMLARVNAATVPATSLL